MNSEQLEYKNLLESLLHVILKKNPNLNIDEAVESLRPQWHEAGHSDEAIDNYINTHVNAFKERQSQHSTTNNS